MASVQCGIVTRKSQNNASLHRYGFHSLIPNHKKKHKKFMRTVTSMDCIFDYSNALKSLKCTLKNIVIQKHTANIISMYGR